MASKTLPESSKPGSENSVAQTLSGNTSPFPGGSENSVSRAKVLGRVRARIVNMNQFFRKTVKFGDCGVHVDSRKCDVVFKTLVNDCHGANLTAYTR